jgi:hypothetical protein
MKNGLLVLLFLTTVISPSSAIAAANEDDFHSLIVEHYSFSPPKLSNEERELKSKALDSFWSWVSSDRVTLLPKLREELDRTDNSPFFYYDGSKLLLSLSKETKDKQLAVMAIARSDLSEIQAEDYVRTILRLGTEGIDTVNAAFRVLDYPDFTVVVPAHSLKLGQDYSLILMVLQLPDYLFVEKAIRRLQGEKDRTARKSLLRALWCAATDLGDETIARVASDASAPDEVRKFASGLLDETTEIISLPASTIEKLWREVALSQALRKAGPALFVNRKDKSVSKDQIESIKLFMEALSDSGEETARRMLSDFAKNSDGSFPTEISRYADHLLNDDGKSRPPSLPPSDVASLKSLRRAALSGVTDEALYDFRFITAIIRWSQGNKARQDKDKEIGQPGG